MKTIQAFLFVFLFCAAAASAAPVPAPPAIAGTGHLLIDMYSGQVLAQSNADTRLEPASLTKIMTAHVVFEELRTGAIKLEDEVTVSKKAWKTPGSRMFIEVNTRVPVGELLKGLIIQSGNDASVALAEHIAGSEEAFANLMNVHARRLGMASTHFTNATGLPHPDHYTTPRDLARLTVATIRDYPEFYKLYAVREYTWNEIRQHNRNNLLWRDDSVDGVKTGHTEAAGYCLVASASRAGMRLVSVVMGTDSNDARTRESQSLLNYGFRFFETHRLYGAGDELLRARVWGGEHEMLGLGLENALFVTIPRNQYRNLQARTELQPNVRAPLIQGQPVGKVVVELAGRVIREVPLVALSDMPEGGLWRQTVDTVLQWLE